MLDERLALGPMYCLYVLENLQCVLILRRLLLLFLLLHIPRVVHWFTRVNNITEILLKVALTL